MAQGQQNNQKSAQTVKFFRFPDQGTEMYVNWLGGIFLYFVSIEFFKASMFASVREAVACRSISRQYWLDNRSLPDWTDFVEQKYPSGRTDMQG